MAIPVSLKFKFFTLSLISITGFGCNSGHAEDNTREAVTDALLCFNNKLIYNGCDEAYRLDQSGHINVPRDATDQFCNGPCLVETQLVLNCIEKVFSNFIFYNTATISDIRYTLNAGCSYTSQRGYFNVEEYIQRETSRALVLLAPTSFYSFVLTAWSFSLLLYHL